MELGKFREKGLAGIDESNRPGLLHVYLHLGLHDGFSPATARLSAESRLLRPRVWNICRLLYEHFSH